MRYILLGSLAFIIAFFFDLAALKRIPYLKQGIGLISVFLFSYSLIRVCFEAERLRLPKWLSYLGWPLLLVSIFLFVYSLFLEIPLRRTYGVTGVGDELVKTGTYALVRHPGVLWFALFIASLLLVSRSKLLLMAAPPWLSMDVLYVWIQEHFYFPKMFPGYEQYKQETPMLVPNRDSITRCFETLREG